METLSIRDKRQWITFFYHFSVISISLVLAKLGSIIEIHVLTRLAIAALLAHLLTFRIFPISEWIQTKLIRKANCGICGADFELENLYQCTCGYIQVRHAFSPCPMCGTEFLWVVCPECDSSIAI
jgi:hypothetical protein